MRIEKISRNLQSKHYIFIVLNHREFQIKYEESKHKEEEAKRKLVNFNDNKIKFYNKYNQVMERKEMNNKKMDFKTLNELGKIPLLII